MLIHYTGKDAGLIIGKYCCTGHIAGDFTFYKTWL